MTKYEEIIFKTLSEITARINKIQGLHHERRIRNLELDVQALEVKINEKKNK